MVMDFDRYKKINDERPNYREMEDASVISSYRNTGCGDGYRIYLKVNDDHKVEDASYTTTGCGFGVVALEMATFIAKGKTIAELKNVTSEDIEKEFSFPERRKNYPQSAVSALQQAVKDYENNTGVPLEKRVTREKALELLQSQGHLRGAELGSVLLEKVDFQGIDCSGADLHNSYLQNSNLRGANFQGAKLRGAFLNNADLREANFSGADLRWAKLAGAKIEGAIFKDAIYDIGTRVDQNQIHIFQEMKKEGKDIYLKANQSE
jgi:NifU-like protein involved in Fe-S cluster formation